MLLERDRFVPAERLMDVFWPRLEPTAAANNLQGVVFKLRRWLEPDLPRGRDSRYLVTEAEGYRFLAASCRVDLDEFAQAAQAGQAALRGDDLPAARAALERARDLYRGELLADMPYAEWVFPARERLREAHLEALEALGHTCLRLGAYDDTLAVARQARAVDPLREAFVRQQMQARAALGERAEALAVCEEYERLLAEELGVEPSMETRALREAILAGAIAPAAPAIPAAPAMSVELPLVGRDDILASLERVRQDGGGLVLLSGEAGMGKTRLLAEFTDGLGTDVFWNTFGASRPPTTWLRSAPSSPSACPRFACSGPGARPTRRSRTRLSSSACTRRRSRPCGSWRRARPSSCWTTCTGPTRAPWPSSPISSTSRRACCSSARIAAKKSARTGHSPAGWPPGGRATTSSSSCNPSRPPTCSRRCAPSSACPTRRPSAGGCTTSPPGIPCF